jgi:hypothetical protein
VGSPRRGTKRQPISRKLQVKILMMTMMRMAQMREIGSASEDFAKIRSLTRKMNSSSRMILWEEVMMMAHIKI